MARRQVFCSASKDQYYKERKSGRGRCVFCQPCPKGTGRNFTEQVNLKSGPNGDLTCYSCRPCKDGTYNRGSLSQCKLCTDKKCYKLGRKSKFPCSKEDDEVCSAECLKGYYDEHEDTGMPCKKVSSLDLPVKPASGSIPDNGHKINAETVALAVVSGIAIVALIIAFAIYKYRQKQKGKKRPTETALEAGQSSTPLVQPVGSSNESELGIQQSTLAEAEAEAEIAYVRYDDNLSALEVDGPVHPQPELPEATAASANTKSSFFGPHPELSESFSVHGHQGPFPRRLVKGEINLVQRIAAHIPKDPIQLFKKLDLEEHDFYPDQEKFLLGVKSHKEYVYQVLMRWTEIRGDLATTDILFEALSEVGFKKALDEALDTQTCCDNN